MYKTAKKKKNCLNSLTVSIHNLVEAGMSIADKRIANSRPICTAEWNYASKNGGRLVMKGKGKTFR